MLRTLDYAMTIICNVSNGDFTKQSADWQMAAGRFVSQYSNIIKKNRLRLVFEMIIEIIKEY